MAAFIYGDLIVVPLILIYENYYGWRTAIYITLVMFVSMIAAVLVMERLFSALHLIPTGPRPPSAISHAMFRWNYDTDLDIGALGVVAILANAYFSHPVVMGPASRTAHDGEPGR